MPMVVATASHYSPREVTDQEQSNRSRKISQQKEKQLCIVHGHHCRADHNPSLRAEWRAKTKG
jgi:calcineurin-like phosphoesterase family protein